MKIDHVNFMHTCSNLGKIHYPMGKVLEVYMIYFHGDVKVNKYDIRTKVKDTKQGTKELEGTYLRNS